MSKFAQQTSVSVERSVTEIQRILNRYGADGFGFATQGNQAMVQFTKNNKVVKFLLKLPSKDSKEFTMTKHRYSPQRRSEEAIYKVWEQACRQRWRALALVVKAKLEAVDAGITTFENEFMAHILLADGRTVGEIVLPEIEKAYKLGKVPSKLLLTEGFDSETNIG